MSSNNHTLRVALVWNGSVYRERTFSRTSDPVVTVGDDEDNVFNTPAPGIPSEFEMFEREDNGYKVRFAETLEGSMTINGDEWTLDELVDKNKAIPVDSVSTIDGMTQIYEISFAPGDWGIVHLGDVDLYFQVLGQPAVVAGRGLQGIDGPVVGTVALAAFLHVTFLLIAFLAFDINPELQRRKIPDRFAKFMVDDVEEPLDKEKKKEPSEDTTAKKAGGKEGKFGKKDSKKENKIPKVDGPMKKKVDVKNVGVNKMLASDKLGSGPLKNIFGNQDGFDSKMKVAMSGEGGQLQVGRGKGGMGLRGTGGGGGGEGFGRVHGLGNVDTGGGKGTGAKLAEKKQREVEPNMSRGSPKVGDFCDKDNIRKVVSTKSRAIQYCYERQLQMNPKLKGKVGAQGKVSLDGSVKTASVMQSTLGNSKVESCITRVIKRMRFEKPDGGICVINYPFVFSGVQ